MLNITQVIEEYSTNPTSLISSVYNHEVIVAPFLERRVEGTSMSITRSFVGLVEEDSILFKEI